MLIAVFGDLHGRIKLAYKLCQRWEKEKNQKLGLILQVGDLGVWPDVTKLDKATLRHVLQEIDELGFHEFMEGSENLDSLLDSVSADLYFTEGNHADFDFLQACKSSKYPTSPIDAYHKLNYITSGRTFEYAQGNEKAVIGALTGIDKSHVRKPGKRHEDAYFKDRDLQQLSAYKGVNILLTHHGPFSKRQLESEKIHWLSRSLAPQYHFFGHLHIEDEIKKENTTFLVQMNLLGFRNSGAITKQGFGILDWKDKNNHKFEFVTDSWLEEYTKYTWENI